MKTLDCLTTSLVAAALLACPRCVLREDHPVTVTSKARTEAHYTYSNENLQSLGYETTLAYFQSESASQSCSKRDWNKGDRVIRATVEDVAVEAVALGFLPAEKRRRDSQNNSQLPAAPCLAVPVGLVMRAGEQDANHAFEFDKLLYVHVAIDNDFSTAVELARAACRTRAERLRQLFNAGNANTGLTNDAVSARKNLATRYPPDLFLTPNSTFRLAQPNLFFSCFEMEDSEGYVDFWNNFEELDGHPACDDNSTEVIERGPLNDWTKLLITYATEAIGSEEYLDFY